VYSIFLLAKHRETEETNPMKLTVISYQESREWNDACHCHPEYQHAPSNLSIATLDGVQEAAEWIASKIDRGREHSFYNGVFLGGNFHPDFLPIEDPTTYHGAASVEINFTDDGDVIGSEIRARISEILTLRDRERAESERKRAEESKQAYEKQVQREKRQQLARLKKELGEE
jgi:hypothetical protein